MSAFREASKMREKERPYPCAPPPSPITGSRRNFDLSVSPLSSSPESSFKDEDIEMNDFLVMALSRMNVEQSSLKRKKHSEYEISSGYEGHDIVEHKKAKCKRKHKKSSGHSTHTRIPEVSKVNSTNTSLPMPT
ncbi:predicted protein [Nematostella vectensis]|uniref:Uncharacterized protein n=1 Tax=Nematostella vectensis TaxID=45351 RepID=A7RZ07_NEMVE|nr:predicted protein [Nematostella vectensis]|eukprot:XP_001635383.1 predicted protein [Nematostella vectensis]